MLLERGGQPLGQLLGGRHHHAQAAEILRRAAAHVELQEGRRRQQERQGVLADERADGFGVERVGMVDHPHAQHRRQAERAREAEGMEERQHAHKAVVAVQAEDLFELLDVRADVVVAEHHALRLAGAAAGEDDGRQVVQRGLLLASERALEQADRQEPGAEQRAELLAGAAASAATSSRKTVSPGTLSFTLSRKAREVSTVLIPHWRMQEASVSSDTV